MQDLCEIYEIKMAHGNTTELRKHLCSKHPNEYFVLFPKEEQKEKKQQTTATSTSRVTIPELFSAKFSSSNSEDNLESAIVDWVAIKYLPFNFFNDDTEVF